MPAISLPTRTTRSASSSVPSTNARIDRAALRLDGSAAELGDQPVPLHHLLIWLTTGAAGWVTIAVVVSWITDLRLPFLP